MQKSTSIKILITLICMLLGVYLPSSFLWVIAAINVLTIGVIHGANDLFILSKTIKTTKKTSFSRLFISYVFFVFIMVLALRHVPQWALLLFVLTSAFHFGEQQWHRSSYDTSLILHVFYTAFGFLIFSLLFYTHQLQTNVVLLDLTGIQIPETVFATLLYASFFVSIVTLFFNYNQLKSQLLPQLLILTSLVTLFYFTSLLWSFSVYFVLWHSIPSLREQARVLYPDHSKPMLKYIRLAMPYWLLAMLGLGAGLFWFYNSLDSLLAIFFGFLAAITIPHVVVIFWMHKKK